MKRHVLVVEDEKHLAIGLQYNLEAEGFRVTIAEDGRTALETLEDEDHDFHLVILDIMLPGMSGYDVCEAARAKGSELPILMLSARNLAEDRARGFDVGADQYLTKPFELEELLSRVRNLISRFHDTRANSGQHNDNSSTKYEIAGVQVNFDSYEVSGRGGTQRLTPLEIRLLRYFIQNEGRVIPRYELLEEVWEMSGDANSRAPDQFIRRLRKTFEPDPSRPIHFLTIRDGGYRYVSKPE